MLTSRHSGDGIGATTKCISNIKLKQALSSICAYNVYFFIKITMTLIFLVYPTELTNFPYLYILQNLWQTMICLMFCFMTYLVLAHFNMLDIVAPSF
jgi:hypothetical protein